MIRVAVREDERSHNRCSHPRAPRACPLRAHAFVKAADDKQPLLSRNDLQGVPKRVSSVAAALSDDPDEPLYAVLLAFRVVPQRTLAVASPSHRSSLFARLGSGAYTYRRSMSVFNSSRLQGKTVLVTGASAGIGAVRTIVTLP